MSSTLHFPSQETIVAYLDKHPLTSGKNIPFFKEKGINKAMAEVFAKKVLNPLGVNVLVMLTMADLGKKLGYPSDGLIVFNPNLSEALRDCAKASTGLGAIEISLLESLKGCANSEQLNSEKKG